MFKTIIDNSVSYYQFKSCYENEIRKPPNSYCYHILTRFKKKKTKKFEFFFILFYTFFLPTYYLKLKIKVQMCTYNV